MLFCFFSISDSEELLLYIIVKHFVICIFETRRVNTFYLLVCKKPKKKEYTFILKDKSEVVSQYARLQLGGHRVRRTLPWKRHKSGPREQGPRFLHFKGFRSSARSASSPSNHPSSLRPEPPTRSFRNEMRSRVRRRNGEKRLNNRERRSGEEKVTGEPEAR